jgi:Transposase DDE domain group 1
LVLLRQVDRWIGLTKSLAQRLPEGRDTDKIEHSLESMLRQRIYGLALGYEDLNDHDFLRKDLLWQTASERREELASCSTLCRFENRAGRKEAWLIHEILFDQFVGSRHHPKHPTHPIVDEFQLPTATFLLLPSSLLRLALQSGAGPGTRKTTAD